MTWEYWVLFALLLLSSCTALFGKRLASHPKFANAQTQVRLGQGILGLVTLGWGLYCLISLITSWLGFVFLITLAGIVLAIGLGLLLGYRLVSKQAAATGLASTGDKVEAKLSSNNALLGIAGLVVVLLLLIVELSTPSIQGYIPTPVPAPNPAPLPLPLPTPSP